MIKLNSKKIAEIVGSPMVVVDADVDEVVTDSRVAKRGDLFIAIKGEKFDGHDFVKDVIARGVEVVVVQKQLPERIERHYFENKDGLDEFLLNKLLQNNDIVLIKGARYSSELYKVTESLIKHG